jgi:hypothetical protein
MALFEINDPDADSGYRNLRAAPDPSPGGRIRQGLEVLWSIYEPYADSNFIGEFARHPDERFWEMYLTVKLLKAGRHVRTRAELTTADRDTGPDICIRKVTRKIWIEAVSPGQGDTDKNPDRVPDVPQGGGQLESARREVELRITTELLTKAERFQAYRDQAIVGENDSCIVAISAGQFPFQAIEAGLPPAVTAVYPFGAEELILDKRRPVFLERRHHHSPEIKRVGAPDDPIPRNAFQDERFAHVSGLIWSLRSIGNFLGQAHDFIYIHNSVARKPIPRAWNRWVEEYIPVEQGQKLKVTKR